MTDFELLEDLASPEQIYRETPIEKSARERDRRRRYIEAAPEELREERAALYDLVQRSTEAIMKHVQACHRLPHFPSPEVSSGRARDLEGQMNEALAESKRLGEQAQKLRILYLAHHREWQAKGFPLEKRPRALLLLEARDRAIADLPFDGQAGKMGGLAGRQFRLFRELDAAQVMGKSDEIERIEAELQATKDEYEAVCRQVYQIDARRAIREECEAELLALLEE
jgi:hypothetical protein